MGTFSVKTLNANLKIAIPPRQNRMTAKLRDGTHLALIMDATSATAPLLQLYSSANNGQTWTQRASFSCGTTAFGRMNASMATDDGDNVHIVYQNWNNATKPGIYYVKLSWAAGPVYTVGTQVAIKAAGLYDKNTVIDIDVAGAGLTARPIIYIKGTSGASGASMNYQYYLMASPTSAVLLTNASTTRTNFQSGYYSTGGVAARHTTETSGDLVFSYIMWNAAQGSYYVGIAKTNSAGTVVTTYPSSLVKQTSSSQINFRAFTTRDRGMVWLSWDATKVSYTIIEWDAALAVFTTKYGVAYTIPKGWAALSPDNNDAGWISPTQFVLFTGSSLTLAYATIIDIVKLTATRYAYQLNPAGWASTTYTWASGFNRNFDLFSMPSDPMVLFARRIGSSASLNMSYIQLNTPLAPTSPKPGLGSTVSTDIPALAANLVHVPAGDQSAYSVEWQFATDAAFTTNVKFRDSLLFSAPGTASAILSVISKLNVQGLWYMRMKTTDQYGSVSAWSPTITFTNTHFPVAINSTPSNDAVVVYGAGTIAFSWTFSDPSSVAVQSAYQVVVYDPTGATIVDTGKVVSTDTTIGIAIPSANQDMELFYTIDVWNDQDVKSILNTDASRVFFTSVVPAPAITSPVSGTTLTSGIFNVIWTAGISGTKTQDSWRVSLQDGITGDVLYDSGTRLDTSSNFAFPTGIVHNAKSYVLTLTITDSIGLSNTAVSAFNTSYTLPAAPAAIYIYGTEYSSRGRVWVGWTNASESVDFVQWNVYRRAPGDTFWTLLKSFNYDAPAYGYPDRSARSNVNYQYAVTQITNPNQLGDLVESGFTNAQAYIPRGTYYWLVDPLELLDSVPVYQATADSFTDEYERNTYSLPGRGRKTDIGEHLGANGSITTQTRDRPIGFSAPTVNALADPSFQNQLPFSPNWTFSCTGSVSYGSVAYIESAPSKHDNSMWILSDPGTTFSAYQRMPSLPYSNVGDSISVSCYYADILALWNVEVKAKLEFYNAANVLQQTQTVTLANVENYNGNGNWKRYAASVTGLLAGIARVDITYTVKDTAALGLSGLLTGAQASAGALQPYIDGSLPGGFWVLDPYNSASSTTGFYTARDQRLDIIELVGQGRTLLLVTPFGDIYYVTTGDLGYARLAGVGSQQDFGDLTIPYLESAI